VKHKDFGIKHIIDLHCTDRGRHKSARIGALVEWHDGTIWAKGLRRNKDREALRRRDGATVTDKRIKMRPPNIAEVKEAIRKELAEERTRATPTIVDILASSAARARDTLPERTTEMVCPVCRRNPQISAALLQRIWPQLLAANLPRVDISALPI
jgi:hypothetical protein